MKDPYKKKDEQLFAEVQKLKDGDFSNSNAIYELSEKYIYKIINDIVKNHHTTEDLMQEAYIQIYNKINTLQEVKAFYVWAGRIATNLTLRYIQKNSKEVLATPDEEGDTDFIFEKATDDKEKFIPESVLVDREKQRLLADIIDKLSAEQKFCVQYFYYEEMSVNEIAEVMGCSTGTVKSRLNYARKSIKDAVIELDVKHGTRLYSLASAPLFLIVFRAAAEGLLPAAVVGAASAASAGGASVSAGVSSTGGAASMGSASAAGSVASATAATAAGTVATKAAIVFGAVMILGGGASTAVNASHIVTPQQVEAVVDETEESEEVVEVVAVEETVVEEETVSIDVDIVVEAPTVEEVPEYIPYEEPKEKPKEEVVQQPVEQIQEPEEPVESNKDYTAIYVLATYSDGSTQRFDVAEYNADPGIIYNYGTPTTAMYYNAAGEVVGGATFGDPSSDNPFEGATLFGGWGF